MNVIKYRIVLFSEIPDILADFYTNVMGFKFVHKVDREGEYGYGVEAAKGYKLWIAKHSEVRSKSKEPFRILLSFYVDDAESYFQKVQESKLSKIIEKPTLTCVGIEGEERIVTSFLDPDGNCIQLMQLTGN